MLSTLFEIKGTFNCDSLKKILLKEKATFISLKCFCDKRLLTLKDYYVQLFRPLLKLKLNLTSLPSNHKISMLNFP